MIKPMWNSEAVKAYESGQGVELVNKPYPHYEPAKVTRKQDDDDIQEYVRPWVGLTDKELNVIGSQWHFNLLDDKDKSDLFEFARVIETKLREKNR
jgi:hypothetical protein